MKQHKKNRCREAQEEDACSMTRRVGGMEHRKTVHAAWHEEQCQEAEAEDACSTMRRAVLLKPEEEHLAR